MKKKLIIIFALLVLISISVFFVYYYNIDIQKFFSVDEMRKYVLSFGILGPIVIILICIVAAITTVIPSFLVVFATTAIYGWWASAIITWAGYTIGAGLCFGISKYLGREFVERVQGQGALTKLDRFLGREGFKSIFIARLLPFIPFNLTSYLAGITSISFKGFILGTATGQIPGTIVYAGIGVFFTKSIKFVFLGISIFIVLILITLMLKKKL